MTSGHRLPPTYGRCCCMMHLVDRVAWPHGWCACQLLAAAAADDSPLSAVDTDGSHRCCHQRCCRAGSALCRRFGSGKPLKLPSCLWPHGQLCAEVDSSSPMLCASCRAQCNFSSVGTICHPLPDAKEALWRMQRLVAKVELPAGRTARRWWLPA